jgi:hypothetical protein
MLKKNIFWLKIALMVFTFPFFCFGEISSQPQPPEKLQTIEQIESEFKKKTEQNIKENKSSVPPGVTKPSPYSDLYPAYLEEEGYQNYLERISPELLKMDARLKAIQQETQDVINEYTKGRLSENRAKEKLTALITERIQIQSSQEYQVGQEIATILYDASSKRK